MRLERVLRELAPQVLGALVRRYGDFDTCEDAVQEALLAAAVQWPEEGEPRDPKGWLITVASRRRIELWRNETARRRREESAAALEVHAEPAVDDTLTLLQMCCHPALTSDSQVALTLRAVGGLTTAESGAPVGPYQVQAAIAAVHDEAASASDTDWRQILGLYDLLRALAPGPMVTLNRIVALAMVSGPSAGLTELEAAEGDPALAGHHRVHAVRAHLLELAGDREGARVHYELAARTTLSVPERRYLESRAAP